jgi:hypothetical protein
MAPAGWVSPACAIPKPTLARTIRNAAETIATIEVFIFLPLLLPQDKSPGSVSWVKVITNINRKYTPRKGCQDIRPIFSPSSQGKRVDGGNP